MKIVTFRPGGEADGHQHLGVLSGETVHELAGSLLGELRRNDCLAALREAATGSALAEHRLADVTLCAPLPRPNSIRDFMLVEDHVRGSFGSVPPEWHHIPVYWKGNCDAVVGPEATIPWPYYTDKLDFELELAAVIGRRASRVTVEEAADHIAGYTIFNDWSARDIQMREMTVGLGVGLSKDFATSMGPCLVTANEFDAASPLMRARVNGEIWSEGTLGSMLFSFAEVISHLSQEQTLEPGDVLGSGTVARGCGLELDRWIKQGDVVELEMDGLGALGNTVGPKSNLPTPGAGIDTVMQPAYASDHDREME